MPVARARIKMQTHIYDTCKEYVGKDMHELDQHIAGTEGQNGTPGKRLFSH